MEPSQRPVAEAESLCDRLAILIQGKLAVIGTPAAQVTATGNPNTHIIIRTVKGNLLPGGDIGPARFVK